MPPAGHTCSPSSWKCESHSSLNRAVLCKILNSSQFTLRLPISTRQEELKPGLVLIEKEPKQVNPNQTNNEMRQALSESTAQGRKIIRHRRKKGRNKMATHQIEHLTRADPWMKNDTATKGDVSKWILITMPMSILYLTYL